VKKTTGTPVSTKTAWSLRPWPYTRLNLTVSKVAELVALVAASTRRSPPVSAPTRMVVFASEGSRLAPTMSKFR
jgi:hypothetical protein